MKFGVKYPLIVVLSLSLSLPWHLKSATVDKSLTMEVSKRDSPAILRALAMELIECYSDTVRIYTDASKIADGKTAAAFYVPEQKVERECRLSDNITIFAAELSAIKLALQWSSVSLASTPNKAITIFSDSLSSLNAIEAGRSNCRPKLLEEVLELIRKINNHIVFVWVPSHIGIAGSEAVDKLATVGIGKPKIDVEIPLGIGEAIQLAEKYVINKWQDSWTKSDTGQRYRDLESRVAGGVKYVSKCRSKEVKITRLRLGKCSLNAYLHEIKKHSTGLCDTCNKPETVEHFILDCQNSVSTAVRQACSELKLLPTLAVVLSNTSLIDLVFKNIINRKL